MKPSIGRIVHYRPRQDRKCRAALVIDVMTGEGRAERGMVALKVYDFDGSTRVLDATMQTDTSDGDDWHWPERVE